MKIRGILEKVEPKKSKKGNDWAIMHIREEGTNNVVEISTFNLKEASKVNGKKVDVDFTESGKYKNLDENGLKVIGEGETPITKEEAVEPTKAEEVKNEIKAKRPETAQPQLTDWNTKDQRSMRAMSVSYAKDLVIAGKVELKKMRSTAQSMYEFIWEGYPIEDDSEMVEDDKK